MYVVILLIEISSKALGILEKNVAIASSTVHTCPNNAESITCVSCTPNLCKKHLTCALISQHGLPMHGHRSHTDQRVLIYDQIAVVIRW